MPPRTAGARRDQIILAGLLGLSSVAALAVLAFRAYYSGRQGYSFLAWNLFLAWLPVLFAVAAGRARRGHLMTRWAATPLAFLWLLFFPNAPYLCTDFLHLSPYGVSDHPVPGFLLELSPGRAVPPWFDMLLLLCFAWNGLVLGFLSLYLVCRDVKRRRGPGRAGVLAAGACVLCAFGISLGRFERWNSWDLFSQPGELLADIGSRVLNPLAHPRTTGSTVILAVFLVLAYFTLLAFMRVHRHDPGGAD